MPLEDKATRLRIMREIAKYDMDTSLMNCSVINGVVYIDGRVSPMRSAGAPTDLRRVFENLEDTFRGMRDIQDVVIAVAYDTS
ncbi:MAG TPA: hypothetical protein DEP45_06295 [Armatimonadetes bacterium]|nr:hypothetical protein [Armatimonadota bacterium]